MVIPDEVLRLMNKLNTSGYECYAVGGSVRDALMGRPVHDYDLTSNALPEEMIRVFRPEYTVLPTGIKHGTVTVLSGGLPVEITTYRADGSYSDHRHPDSVTFTRSIREDCARRDFTINAMCCSAGSDILDFFGGREDLKNGIIRCIGVPQDRLDEDALRILRAIRFAARFGFTIEANTASAMSEKMGLLAWVSEERIQSELTGFLSAPSVSSFLVTYRDIFLQILAELKQIPEERWKELAEACGRCSADPAVRLAILLYDAEQPEKIMRRLKYSTADIRTVLAMLEGKELPVSSRIDVRRAMNRISCDFEQYIDFRCATDTSIDRKALTSLYRTITEDGDCVSLKALAVNGSDLKQAGFSGKAIGTALHDALEAVMEDRLENTKEAILRWLL